MTDTDTDLTDQDPQLIVRMLWGFYLTPLAAALACLIGLVVTGSLTYLWCGLMACLAAWFVTDPLDEARFEARMHAGSGT